MEETKGLSLLLDAAANRSNISIIMHGEQR
jgi:hypothetical protein